MAENQILVEFSNADIKNGEAKVIYGLNMQVRRGDFVYLIGKVGSGKTSIIRSIIAENRLGGGSGRVYEYDLSTLREKDIPFLRRKIGIVFQDFHHFIGVHFTASFTASMVHQSNRKFNS
jgi:cell division transport system ATP-binding protein